MYPICEREKKENIYQHYKNTLLQNHNMVDIIPTSFDITQPTQRRFHLMQANNTENFHYSQYDPWEIGIETAATWSRLPYQAKYVYPTDNQLGLQEVPTQMLYRGNESNRLGTKSDLSGGFLGFLAKTFVQAVAPAAIGWIAKKFLGRGVEQQGGAMLLDRTAATPVLKHTAKPAVEKGSKSLYGSGRKRKKSVYTTYGGAGGAKKQKRTQQYNSIMRTR